jgi:hypothetical protein
MNIPAMSDQVSMDWGVRVQGKAQAAAKAEGEAAVKLIEQTKPAPGPEGQGTHINTHA